MKRMMILLTATTLVLVPFASNAKKPPNMSTYELDAPLCSCASVHDEMEGTVTYTCNVSWDDVIANAPNPSTYGASIEVEWAEEGTEMDGSAPAEIEYDDWSEVCDGDTCTVEKVFQLEHYTDQIITLTAAVKAFENSSGGAKPRNFVKSTGECGVVAPIEPI